MGERWIAVDLAPDGVRAWQMPDRAPLDGASDLTALDGGDIVVCGPSAVPVSPVPCAPLTAPVAVDGRWVVPGLGQRSPLDLMQGAETRIAGFLSLNRNWDGVVCVVGAQTVWAQVSADEVVSFQSFLTGEMLALLAQSSLTAAVSEAGDEAAFLEAMDRTLSRPEALGARLAGLRAAHQLGQPAGGRAALAGLLIGAELAAARPYWLGQQIAVIGASEAATPYVRALAHLGAPAMQCKDEAMVLAGLEAAHALMKGPAQKM